MFLNIITPCSRPQNLQKIAESINIPRENYRWLVVFDRHTVPFGIPSICEAYAEYNVKSVFGNHQRNVALSKVSDGHIYFNDDDTLIHPDLWDAVKDLQNDFISFKQADVKGNIRLRGDVIQVTAVDSHNFIVDSKLVEGIEWRLSRYDADGVFASECKKKSKSSIWLDKVLSVYNVLG